MGIMYARARHNSIMAPRRNRATQSKDDESLLPIKSEHAKLLTRHDLHMSVDDGDAYSPLNDHSRLAKRNDNVRYYGDRMKHVYVPQMMCAIRKSMQLTNDPMYTEFDADLKALHSGALTPESFCDRWFKDGRIKDHLDRAHDAVSYRPMTGIKLVARFLYNLLSLGGMLPELWDTLTSATFAVSISVLMSLLTQAQNEVQFLVNEQESWMDAGKFAYNFLQVGCMVIGVLGAIQIVNYFTYCWKSHGRLLREARFAYCMKVYRLHDPNCPKWELEYNPDVDADTAMKYFTRREELCSSGGWFMTASRRALQVLFVPVNPDIARVKIEAKFF